MIGDTSLQDYINSQEKFLESVEYKSSVEINGVFQPVLQFTFVVGADEDKAVVNIPIKDLPIEADNIYFTFEGDSIKLTETFGRYKPDSVKGYVKVPLVKIVDEKKEPKSIQELFRDAYQVSKDPDVTQPTYSLSASASAFDTGTTEIGSNITKIKWEGTFTDGSYSYGTKEYPNSTAAGLSKSYTVTFMEGTKEISSNAEDSSYSFSEGNQIQITSTENKTYLTVTGDCSYKDSRIPVNNLGEDASSFKIADSGDNPLEATAHIQVQGYRASFYGTYSSKLIPNTEQNTGSTSASIRSLTNSKKTLKDGSSFSITIPKGAVRVVIAYPSTLRDLTSVKDVGDSNNEIKSGFKSFDKRSNYETIKVESANKFDSPDYKVYIMDFANPVTTANTFNVTI